MKIFFVITIVSSILILSNIQTLSALLKREYVGNPDKQWAQSIGCPIPEDLTENSLLDREQLIQNPLFEKLKQYTADERKDFFKYFFRYKRGYNDNNWHIMRYITAIALHADFCPNEDDTHSNVLEIATRRDDTILVELALNAGANPNAHSSIFANRIVNFATTNPSILQLFIAKGADVKLTDFAGKYKETPLEWGLTRGCPLASLPLLIQQKIDLNQKDSEGQASLHYLIWAIKGSDKKYQSDLLQKARCLVEYGADIDLKDDDNCNPEELGQTFLSRPFINSNQERNMLNALITYFRNIRYGFPTFKELSNDLRYYPNKFPADIIGLIEQFYYNINAQELGKKIVLSHLPFANE